MVSIYQVHAVTWLLARRLVTGVEHVSLPNILAGRDVIPEVLQRLDPQLLADQMHALLGEKGQQQRADLAAVVRSLEGHRAVSRAGQIVTAAGRGDLLY
jgi:lipid A disaccharide synthetase